MKYKVTIRGSVTKMYVVEAEDEDHASDAAHELFNINQEANVPEDYEQDTVHIEEVTS